MADIGKTRSGPVESILPVLALTALAWAIISLFSPVEKVAVTGTLDSGAAYRAVVTSYGYNSIGTWALILAAVTALLASVDHWRGKANALRTLLWALFAGALAASTFVTGATPIVSWLPGIPQEVQHAIGTQYAMVLETPISNFPAIVALFCIAGYVLAAGVLIIKDQFRAFT